MLKYLDETQTVTVANGATASGSFTIDHWVSFVGVYFPSMDDGNIGLEMSTDNSNFYPVLDISDGDDVVLCKSGSDPGFIDISDLVRFASPDIYLRFTCAAQTGAKNITVFKRG